MPERCKEISTYLNGKPISLSYSACFMLFFELETFKKLYNVLPIFNVYVLKMFHKKVEI
jgi:hypothetical protein